MKVTYHPVTQTPQESFRITEIALGCGFVNVASFRRAKRGNPKQFRRKLQALN